MTMNRREALKTPPIASALCSPVVRATARAVAPEPSEPPPLAPGAMRLRRGIDGAVRDFASVNDPEIVAWSQGGDVFVTTMRPMSVNGIDFGGQYTFRARNEQEQPRLVVPGLRQEPPIIAYDQSGNGRHLYFAKSPDSLWTTSPFFRT